MARVFVTGGSGFLGRNLIGTLLDRGYEVRALARSDAAAEIVARAGAESVQGDLDDDAALRAGMQGCDTVMHAAGLVRDWGHPDDFRRINVLGTERVLDAARAAGVTRLVHVSTEAVLLGAGPLRNVDETMPRPVRPLGLYAWSKRRAEELALAANTPTMATVVVRPRFIWGHGDTSTLPQFMHAVRSRRFRWIAGGRYLTSTCHVANVCEGMVLGAQQGRGGEIYFLTDGQPVEFRSFVTAMLRTQGLDPGNRSVPRWLAKAVAPGSEAVWRALNLKGQPPITRSTVRLIGEEVTVDDAKARRELGYKGAVSREAGLAAMATLSPP